MGEGLCVGGRVGWVEVVLAGGGLGVISNRTNTRLSRKISGIAKRQSGI